MRVNRSLMKVMRDWDRQEVLDPDGSVVRAEYHPRRLGARRRAAPAPPSTLLRSAGLLIGVGLAAALASVIVPFVLPLTA